MLAATLKTNLLAMGLFGTELDAVNAWVDAWTAYFEDAESNAITIVPAALDPAKVAMVGAMSGLSVAGSSAIQSGVVAFWGAIIPATAWPTVTAIVPPSGLSGLAASLDSVFAANIAGEKSAADSYDAIASAMHTVNLGGTAAWPPPPGPGVQPII